METSLDDVLADLESTSRDLHTVRESNYQSNPPVNFNNYQFDEPEVHSAEIIEAYPESSYSSTRGFNDDDLVYESRPASASISNKPLVMPMMPPTGARSTANNYSNSSTPSYSSAPPSYSYQPSQPDDSGIDNDLKSMLGGFKKNMAKNSSVATAKPLVAPAGNSSSAMYQQSSVSPAQNSGGGNSGGGNYSGGNYGVSNSGGNSAPVAGGSTTCSRCNKRIVGKYQVALNRSWHNECFRCLFCNDDLVQWGKFFPSPNKDQPLCERCYRKSVGQ